MTLFCGIETGLTNGLLWGPHAVRFPDVTTDILRACIFLQAIASPPLALLGYCEWRDLTATRDFFFFFCLAPLHAAVYYRPALFLSAPNSFCTVNGMNSADHLHRSLATLIKTVSFHEYVLPCCQYRLASYTSCITGYASSDNSYVLDSLILCARTSISSYFYSSSCSFLFLGGDGKFPKMWFHHAVVVTRCVSLLRWQRPLLRE